MVALCTAIRKLFAAAQWAFVSEQRGIGFAGGCQSEPPFSGVLTCSVMLQSWLLLSLLGDDGGIGAEGLAQQLVRLLDAASHDPAGESTIDSHSGS